jgi:hypothetical protein
MRISVDSRFRGNDNKGSKRLFYESIKLLPLPIAARFQLPVDRVRIIFAMGMPRGPARTLAGRLYPETAATASGSKG